MNGSATRSGEGASELLSGEVERKGLCFFRALSFAAGRWRNKSENGDDSGLK